MLTQQLPHHMASHSITWCHMESHSIAWCRMVCLWAHGIPVVSHASVYAGLTLESTLQPTRIETENGYFFSKGTPSQKTQHEQKSNASVGYHMVLQCHMVSRGMTWYHVASHGITWYHVGITSEMSLLKSEHNVVSHGIAQYDCGYPKLQAPSVDLKGGRWSDCVKVQKR